MNEHDVRFDSDGCILAGTYVEAVQPVAAALLIPGSGRTDRNSDARLPLRQLLRLEGHVVGVLSHLLRPDPDSLGPRGYRRAVRAPVSPEVLSLVTSWVTPSWGAP